MAENIHDAIVLGVVEQEDVLASVAERAKDAPVDVFVDEALQAGDGDVLVDSVLRAAVLASLEQLPTQVEMAARQVEREAFWLDKADPSGIRAVTDVDTAQARAQMAEAANEDEG